NITVELNANRDTLLRRGREFKLKLLKAGPDALGFLYYSGHGVAATLPGESNNSTNYLIPIGVLDDQGPYEFFETSVKLNEFVFNIRHGAFSDLIVVFDACRNELQMEARLTNEKTFVVEPLNYPGNTLLGFASQPKFSASDVGEYGGPYSNALAAELRKPGQ